MEMYPFTYKVIFNDECDNYKIKTKYGVTLAETCSDAMFNIAHFYGDSAIYKCEITAIDDAQSVIELSESEVERLENESILTN